jgi:hypothetical protein
VAGQLGQRKFFLDQLGKYAKFFCRPHQASRLYKAALYQLLQFALIFES